MFRLKPPLPKYQTCFDVTQVLEYIIHLPDNAQLNLKQLSYKALFLTCFSSLSRVSSVSRLAGEGEVRGDNFILPFTSLEKQSRPGKVRGHLVFSEFEEQKLCPVDALLSYLSRVRDIRTSDKSLFVSFVRPHKPVSSKTLARWMTAFVKAAGIDVSKFAQHSTRASTAAYLRTARGLSLAQICKLGDWSEKSGVFEKFYAKFVEKSV